MRAPTMAPGLTLQVCACRIARVMSPCDAHEVEFASATALGVLMPTMAHRNTVSCFQVSSHVRS